ncbi:hypothetical protein TWF106_009437 [Orbilia oligospora]|uniref:Chromatin structure-remodeling complex protein rsc7 n=1 Tax=Orbilia oligospora TaxID=2813651 RepID=A0A6G1M693_ORBOL|nr:hypothetical protein TWF788_006283 [Orbilia oligospora]KAF3196963.1 hypothetical protein TWF679_003852 [Orbilia oligospora]KAF3213600.1 hypothetical protein TWF106_009437 [Orbilia oligospora]KAF3218266.1 hypothetical protein TWF191_008310 [Orbilia oligospora]KAF3245279.1 hypothetical protein TWF192_007480 [Orbilia oligospora]
MNPPQPSTYQQQHLFTPQPSPLMVNTVSLDGSGTINPATLNPAVLSNTSPRGIKRSRSPDSYKDPSLSETAGRDLADGSEIQKRKRGRPPKAKGTNSAQTSPQQVLSTPLQPQAPPLTIPPTVPQQQQVAVPQPQTPAQVPAVVPATPTPVAPTAKPTPAKPVIKALPTVRDHTTDQLTKEGDEYIPRETDDDGEKKVMPTGHLKNGREYKCRTFLVPGRGEKLFMLATECARVLGYRDSYLLFNKNRSLYKIIATQSEKDDLIQKELLPYSYRSRQIAIVTAKSMFRQFGSRVIVNGRRVRDDYWESKARKQGFTEEDPAGEKRPGAAKQRAQQASEAAAAAAQHPEPLYTNDPVTIDTQPQPQMVQPGLGGPAPISLAPLPMIHLTPDDSRIKDAFPNVPRPRQEITGPPYVDRTSSTPHSQLLEQGHQAATWNRDFGAQRVMRAQMYNESYWKSKSPPPMPTQGQGQARQGTQQQIPTPPTSLHGQHAPMPAHPQMTQAPMMSPQQISTLHHQQTQGHQLPVAQTPVRMQNIKADQLHQTPTAYMHQQGIWQPQTHHTQAHMSPPPTGHAQPHHTQPHITQIPQGYQMHPQAQQQHYQPAAMYGQHFMQPQQQQPQQWKSQMQQPHPTQWSYPGNT